MSDQADTYARHAYALDVSGYTILPSQVDRKELDLLRACADRALETARASGIQLKHTGTTAYYKAVRCMYCWGEACERLLEHEAVHALASRLMGNYQLWDMVVMNALPTPAGAKAATTSWHRDADGLLLGTRLPAYLWFFLCLDDATPENGATWVVPGSHRISSKHEPTAGRAWSGDNFENYPSRIQPCAKAGDFLVLDPTLLHTSGRNSTTQARRLLNVGICHTAVQPLMDHWAIAGPAIQKRASDRLRKMLGADRKPLDSTWSLLPPGWRTGNE